MILSQLLLDVSDKKKLILIQGQSKSDIRTMKILLAAMSKLFPAFSFVWLAEETEKILPLGRLQV